MYKENTIAKIYFSMKLEKRSKCMIKSLKNLMKDYFQSFKTLLQNYLLYKDNAIVKLYFSIETGKNVQMKTFKK